MQIIGKNRGNDLVGIAWDDEYLDDDARREHILFDLRERLGPWRIEIRATGNVDEFRGWVAADPYQFILLDMLRQYGSGSRRPDWTGLDLLEELRENSWRPGIPVVMVTGAADHLRQQSYAFRSNEYLKSKYLALDWLATEILEILESQAVRVDRDKIAVFDNTADGRAAGRVIDALEKRYEATFSDAPRLYREFRAYPASSTDAQRVREELRQCLAIVAVSTLPSSTEELHTNDDFLLRLGMALAEPRGVQRLILVDDLDEPLASPIVEQARRLRLHADSPDHDELVEGLLARFNDLRQPGCP